MIDKNEKPKNIKLVSTKHQRNEDYDQSSFDGLQLYKYLDLVLRKSDDKDAIIRALMTEICYLTHFIAHKDNEYVDFRNKVKNASIKDDDLLEWSINPPSISEGTIVKKVDWKQDEEETW